MYRIEAIYNTYRILSVIPLHGLSCFFKTICIMWFLIVWQGLVLETFWYEVHMSISFRYLSALVKVNDLIFTDDRIRLMTGTLDPYEFSISTGPSRYQSTQPSRNTPASSVSGQLQVNGWRSTPGQWMKVIEEFKVIERKTIYVPGMKIVTKFVLWICTYKLSLLKFLSYLS